jgi:hypothetical protein
LVGSGEKSNCRKLREFVATVRKEAAELTALGAELLTNVSPVRMASTALAAEIVKIRMPKPATTFLVRGIRVRI